MACLEDDAGAAEVMVIVAELWIDHGEAGRTLAFGLVVIEYKYVDTLRAEACNFRDGAGAAIKREEELRLMLGDAAREAFRAKAVAFIHAQREKGVRVRAEPS